MDCVGRNTRFRKIAYFADQTSCNCRYVLVLENNVGVPSGVAIPRRRSALGLKSTVLLHRTRPLLLKRLQFICGEYLFCSHDMLRSPRRWPEVRVPKPPCLAGVNKPWAPSGSPIAPQARPTTSPPRPPLGSALNPWLSLSDTKHTCCVTAHSREINGPFTRLECRPLSCC